VTLGFLSYFYLAQLTALGLAFCVGYIWRCLGNLLPFSRVLLGMACIAGNLLWLAWGLSAAAAFQTFSSAAFLTAL
jgi:hypothetical protein